MTKHLSLDEIAERLALPKTTVWYWIKDLPLGRPKRWSTAQRKGNQGMRKKYRLLREAAYARGLEEYDELVSELSFRDFVMLYITEGFKRGRNTASICNSDPDLVALAFRWMVRLSGKQPKVRVHYHADQDVPELRAFWSSTLQIDPHSVEFHRKTNSGQMRSRVWRCVHGVAAVEVYDTYFRSRIGAWMDRIRADWS
jgi:hypothetical protein